MFTIQINLRVVVVSDAPASDNPLSTNPTKWSDTHKQFVGKSRRIV